MEVLTFLTITPLLHNSLYFLTILDCMGTFRGRKRWSCSTISSGQKEQNMYLYSYQKVMGFTC